MTDERIKEDDFINIKGLKFKSPFEMMKWITKAVVEIEKLKEEIEEQRKLIETQYAENQTLGNNNATLIHRLGELSERVEKMKCCENCEHCGSDEAIGENGDFSDYTCIQCDDLSTKEKPYPNWRLAE